MSSSWQSSAQSIFLITLCMLLLSACQLDGGSADERTANQISDAGGKTADQMQKPLWRAELQLPDAILPFQFTIGKDHWLIHNGEERIKTSNKQIGDTLYVRLPVFDSEIRVVRDKKTLKGHWINFTKTDYQIPFTARKGEPKRFEEGYDWLPEVADPSGNWEVNFLEEAENGETNKEEALGRFSLENDVLTGTFLTPTGDYRFLEGTVAKDSLYLSCFDGAHAFLFKAVVEGDSMKGSFWSGSHWKQDWIAWRNDDYTLPDANELTFLNEGYERMAFSFPNLEGKTVSFDDAAFKDKVVLVQIMGSWCPNCKDELDFYSKVYPQYKDLGFEIITLTYEAGKDPEGWKKAAQRMQDHYQLEWPVLLAGRASKKEAAESLPMLNHVMSFPTSIFIDKTGKVRRIHTGFSGPATGADYDKFVADFHKTLATLLKE